ncbi:MAG: MarR family transcriptional regulator [Bacillota bacterium]|jgi:DNA-binding MarR family transcriptional regulator|nr:MarR family transcriptional regulator [Bacillota bacterium]MDD3298477.1 MarR family transcriptional regulator [Bacillota bacterium]MDD3851251.1 MarR family transcriptional regulator [Bacillota bacterium]MDD4707076.1 MarR family transcriptional regulator [Bacillota bacterium]
MDDNEILDDILKLIKKISLQLDTIEKCTLISLHLSANQSMVLSVIDRDLSFTHTSINRQTGISKSTLTGTLRAMENKGLIERVKSESDKRKTYINLTHQGKALRIALMSGGIAYGSSAAAYTTELEKKLLFILLKKLSYHLEPTQ